MIDKKKVRMLRKAHRFLGVFLGIQFLFWTVSGLYFSWSDLDEIHGDHLKDPHYQPPVFHSLAGLTQASIPEGVQQVELRALAGAPYYWVNDSLLIHAETGQRKQKVSEQEALAVARAVMSKSLQVASVELIHETGPHHEYRGRPLPAYVISYQHPDEVKAYVSQADGKFQRIRHRSWRWFDFLWMTHTMDYQGRDDFNTSLLRAFSLLGVVTVLSGFGLWFATLGSGKRRK